MSEIKAQIVGMTCSACAARLEKGLSRNKLIKNATVNFALESANIIANDEFGEEQFIQAVQKMGFDAVILKESKDPLFDIKKDELKKQKNRLILSIVLVFPLLLTMFEHFSFIQKDLLPHFLFNPLVQLLFATPIQFFIGWQFYKGSYISLKNNSANMDVLVALGTSSAYFYSLFNTIKYLQDYNHPHLYYETSGVLITLILLGKYFESIAKLRSLDAITTLLSLGAKEATVIRDNIELTIPVSQIKKDEIVIAKAGEKIAVDGIIIDGFSSIDESMLSGESIPVEKNIGDIIYAGTINNNGLIKYFATKDAKHSTLSQIVESVKKAQDSKAPIQRVADKISNIFVPIVVMISVITFLIWYFMLDSGNFALALENSVAVLVIACPCALGLATPTSIMVASAMSAKKGILFKSAEYLEITSKATIVLFDKTGTLTQGNPQISDVFFEEYSKDLRSYIYSLEKNSNHPLAIAITNHFKDNTNEVKIINFEELAGFGTKAIIDKEEILFGSLKFIKANCVLTEKQNEIIQRLESQAKTIMALAIDKKCYAILGAIDNIKPTAKQTILDLKNLGIKVAMLTGDNFKSAKVVASKLDIENIDAEVLPNEKANVVTKYQNSGELVAFVGDGINDAPALAKSDIGISIGKKTDVAVASGAINLLKDDPADVLKAIKIAKATLVNIKQNLFWALLYNSIGIPIAAFGFLAPQVAGMAMAFSSISVVLNAMRLQKVKLD